ncbi:MAG TPA: hypothetical protein ENI99_10630 [Sedimenticola sp.]|nr:hypothetical protein [Sedimenticola sp.]
MLGITWRLLASHNLALVLLALLTLAVAAGGTLPQIGRLSSSELTAWYNDWPALAAWLDFFDLSRVFGSGWFLALCLALLVNMAAGMVVCVSRRYGRYRGRAAVTHRLRGAGPLPATPPPLFEPPGAGPVRPGCRARGVAGLWGIPLFHAGIALIVLGGLWSSWVGYGAHLELAEGEPYSGGRGKLVPDRGDLPPFEFGVSLRLDRVHLEVAGGKYLRELQAHFSIQEEGGPVEQALLETNRPLAVGAYRLYPDNTMGYSAVFDRIRPDGRRRRLYINFPVSLPQWERPPPLSRSTLVELDGVPLYYRMTLKAGARPALDLGVRRAGELVFEGELLPGSEADLGPYRLVFRGVAPWLGFYLTSDRPMLLVFAGFVLTLGGFFLHLVIRFRRVEMLTTPEGWEVRAWVMRGDWRFGEQWDLWRGQLETGAK